MKRTRFSDFPPEEYKGRLRKARKLMEQHRIDALFLTQKENLRYLAGYNQGAWVCKHFYFFSLFPVDSSKDPTLFLPLGDPTGKASWIEDIREYTWLKGYTDVSATLPNSLELVLEVLKEKGLSKATIGLETSPDLRVNMGIANFEAFRKALPEANLVDASDLLWELRSIKSKGEVEKLRKACSITCNGVKAGFEALEAGMTERELGSIMVSEMFKEGASESGFICLYAGPRQMWADTPPSDYRLREGDLIQFDGGCVYDGYWCDFKRMACLGKPDPKRRRFYDLEAKITEAAVAALKAGGQCRDAFHVVADILKRAGYGKFVDWCLEAGRVTIGHGIGLDIHEQPGLSAYNETTVRPGMVFCVEPFVNRGALTPWWRAKEKYGLEDEVVVTRDGPEVLTSEDLLTHDLWTA